MINRKSKRTKEQEQLENIFNNLFKPKNRSIKTETEEKTEGETVKEEQSISSSNSHKESLPKENLGKDILSKESLPKTSLGKVDLLKRGNYTVIDNHILDYVMKKLKPNQFVVYLYLYRKTYGWNNDTNEVSISSSTLQEELGMSHVTIGKHISVLEKEGLVQITKEKNRNRSRTYKVILPSQIDDYLPKESLGKNYLPKGFNNITEKNFRLTPKESLGKKSLGKESQPLKQQDPSESNLASKNNIIKNNIKNNNKAMLLFSSNTVNLPEPIIYNLVERTNYKNIERWLRFIEDKKDEIDNPSGFFRCAIEQDWEIPPKWKDSYERKKEMEKQAKEEEERIAQEKAEWESWLKTLSDNIYKQAEQYAERKVEESPFTPSSKEVKNDMLEGFKKEFLRSKYEEHIKSKK